MAVLVSDSFNRADSTTTLGTTDSYNGGTAQAWVMYGPAANLPTYGISTNRAYMVSNNGGFTTASYAGIDVAQSDVKYTLTLATSAAVSFILRASNNNHYITLAMGNPITLNTFNAGTTTQIASAGVPSATGDVFEITLSGSTITVLKNGSQIISATSTFNQTSTIFGFSGGGSTAARFDNYIVEDLSSGGVNQPASPQASAGTSATTDAGAIGQQSNPGTSAGTSSTNDANPVLIQGSNAGTSGGLSVSSDVTSGAQQAQPQASNGISSTSGEPVQVQGTSGNSAGTSSSSDAKPIQIYGPNAGVSSGTSSTAWVVPRTGVDTQPDSFKILH